MTPTRHHVRVPEELRALMPRFLSNRQADLEQLRTAAARSDFETARRIGHILKGAGGGYGFPQITELAASLEQALKSGADAPVVKDRTHSLCELLRAVVIPEAR